MTLTANLAKVSLASLLVLTSGWGVAAQDDIDVAALYSGKELTIIIPTNPGGDRALYTLAFASFFSRHIPGNPTVVPQFMSGAGGSIGLNYTFSVADPDGLTIVTPLTSVLNAQLIGEESVQYDAREFKWIGRTSDATRVLVVGPNVQSESLDDLREERVIVGAVGQASETYSNAAFLNDIFGTNFDIISGYGGSANIVLAVLNGETDGAFTTWNNIKSGQSSSLEDGSLRVLLQMAMDPNPDLAGVPLLYDLAETEEDRQLVALMSTAALMGQSFAAPPGTPDVIVEALREAFEATMNDPEFRASLEAAQIEFNPMAGSDLEELVLSIMETPQEVIDRYSTAIAGQ